MSTFKILSENPNVGNGCLCSEVGGVDCKGPFAVFYGAEPQNWPNPHSVLSVQCAQNIVHEVAKREDADG